ncbi:MAG TPA: DUF3311 domain-containing protein [Pseudonocardiaceae bacterium]
MTVSPPRIPPRAPDRPRVPRLRWNGWNLLLLVPLLSLLTPIYNREEPALLGMPFFYWFQLLGLGLGVGATALVYVMTRDTEFVVTDLPDRIDVDSLDEGSR